MADPRDYKLDLSTGTVNSPQSEPTQSAPSDLPARGAAGVPSTSRPYVGVQFDCCKVYLRIYRSADGKSYRGRCPKCGVPVHFAVGSGGTDSRTFVVR